MKMKQILSVALAFAMCMGIALPAWAAEETINDGCFVKAGINETSKILEDVNISLDGENKQVMVNIVSPAADKEVQQSDIINAYSKAMVSYKNDMEFDSHGKPDGTFNYTLVGEDEIYFYEQTANSPMQAEMDVVLLTEEDKMEMQRMYVQRLLNEMSLVDLTPSYHAKMYINNTTIKYSSSSITLPESNKVSVSVSEDSPLFLYGGFSGGFSANAFDNVEADMGLMYNNPEKDVWKCFVTITSKNVKGNKVTETGTFLPNRMEATVENGYLPGEDITIVCVPYNESMNLDNSTWGTKGSIVLKAYGIARYADKNGNGGPTKLTSIIESKKVYNLEKVDYHKWVTSIGGSSTSSAYNVGVFKDITIDDEVQANSKFNYNEGDGTVQFSNIGKGKITMSVRK